MKKLAVTKIVNELEESAFFHSNKKNDVTPPPPQTASTGNSTERDTAPREAFLLEPERPNDRSPERAQKKRIITRNSFEIYEDQMEALRRLAYKEKLEGRVGSMSAMVREAIDTYINNQS
jgi:hypothetical protein